MRFGPLKSIVLAGAAAFGAGSALGQEALRTGQPTPEAIMMQPAVTETAQMVHDFHDSVLVIITAITIFVMLLMIWVMIRYNRRANPKPRQFSHNTAIEIAWTVLPVLVLIFIAYKSFPLLYREEVMPQVAESEVVDVKVYGRQWFWSYIYGEGDKEVSYDSNLIPDEKIDPAKGQVPKLSVDNPMVVPAGKYIRVSVSASDVIHSFAMPSFAIKIDAVPGRLNQVWFKVDRPGVYYGQCSELCGVRHAYMPIEIRVLPLDQYNTWLQRAAVSTSEARTYLDQVQSPAAQVAMAR
jgi:cytochrome c oxidase subunit 2